MQCNCLYFLIVRKRWLVSTNGRLFFCRQGFVCPQMAKLNYGSWRCLWYISTIAIISLISVVLIALLIISTLYFFIVFFGLTLPQSDCSRFINYFVCSLDLMLTRHFPFHIVLQEKLGKCAQVVNKIWNLEQFRCLRLDVTSALWGH